MVYQSSELEWLFLEIEAFYDGFPIRICPHKKNKCWIVVGIQLLYMYYADCSIKA